MKDIEKLIKQLNQLNTDQQLKYVSYRTDFGTRSVHVLKKVNNWSDNNEEILSLINVVKEKPFHHLELKFKLGKSVQYLNYNQTKLLIDYLYHLNI